jgi:hypothetical protein
MEIHYLEALKQFLAYWQSLRLGKPTKIADKLKIDYEEDFRDLDIRFSHQGG